MRSRQRLSAIVVILLGSAIAAALVAGLLMLAVG
jgi:hypothetical protein